MHPCTGFLLQKNLLVLRDQTPVARGIVFVNRLGQFGSIGFFECQNDTKAVQLLVDKARQFCKKQGVTEIYAPMNGSMWASYRLMTRGFTDRPFLGEPYNMAYYCDVLTECGFILAKTWETKILSQDPGEKNLARYRKLTKLQKAKTIRVRRMDDFDEDIRIIHGLAMNAFADFYLFHEIDQQVFVKLYADLKLICDKRTVRIAFNDEGLPIGFGIALPDYRSTLAYVFRYAKRYSFLYLGTVQEEGKALYPLCCAAVVSPILESLYTRGKVCICAMMGDGAQTQSFAKEYESLHEYGLFKLEVD
jgi:hypothetical protein